MLVVSTQNPPTHARVLLEDGEVARDDGPHEDHRHPQHQVARAKDGEGAVEADEADGDAAHRQSDAQPLWLRVLAVREHPHVVGRGGSEDKRQGARGSAVGATLPLECDLAEVRLVRGRGWG